MGTLGRSLSQKSCLLGIRENIDRTECDVLTVLTSPRSAAVSVRDSRLGDNNKLSGDACHRRPLQARHPSARKHSGDRMSRSTRPNVLKHNEDRMLCSRCPVFPPEVPRHRYVTRALTCFRGGPTTTSPGMEAVNPSTQHIPTTVILSEPSCSVVCGCWCW